MSPLSVFIASLALCVPVALAFLLGHRLGTTTPARDDGRRPRTDGGTDDGRRVEMVVAYVRAERLDDVKQALAETGAPSLTVTEVSGRGSEPSVTGQWRGEEYTVDLRPKVKVECVVADAPTAAVVAAVADAARTGEPGDGKVFVLPVSRALDVRSGRRGPDAV